VQKFAIPIQLRWTDIDANRHMRHSAYYDLGAIVRVNFFLKHGLATSAFEEMNIGIILFREEALFKREIVYEDKIEVDVEITKASSDFSRWSLRHRIYKNGDTIAAIITVDGAWIDMQKRRLTIPGDRIQRVFAKFPKADDFDGIVRGN
jgi:acyl-CoA thioester hydrolase